MILFFDTETTGLPSWKMPSDDPSQPKLVQIAMQLTTSAGQERAAASMLVQTGDSEMPAEALDIHGIKAETANTYGVDPLLATYLYREFRRRATLVVAHGVTFDERIMKIAMLRNAYDRPAVDALHGAPSKFCTMQEARRIAKRQGYDFGKAPTLSEAVYHFLGERMEGAHDARHDMAACRRLYFKLCALQQSLCEPPIVGAA